jgi:hypothetical protein
MLLERVLGGRSFEVGISTLWLSCAFGCCFFFELSVCLTLGTYLLAV